MQRPTLSHGPWWPIHSSDDHIVQVYMVDEKKLSGAASSSLTLRRAVENTIQHGLFEDWCVCVRAKS